MSKSDEYIAALADKLNDALEGEVMTDGLEACLYWMMSMFLLSIEEKAATKEDIIRIINLIPEALIDGIETNTTQNDAREEMN
jgi:hypothetical protein